MDKLVFGETAVLEDGTEYVCFAQLEENGVDYVYLVSNVKPLKVRFASQRIVNGQLQLEIVQDQELKLHLLELFKEKMGSQEMKK